MTLVIDPPIGPADLIEEQAGVSEEEADALPDLPLARFPVVSFDPRRYASLLEDCELSRWATEAGAKYLVSEVEALWLLAQALLLDGRSSLVAGAGSKNEEIRAHDAS